MQASWLTFPCLGSAYRKLTIASTLTHKFNPETNVVLCGKVKPESICDDYTFDTTEEPTCPTCAKRFANMKETT